MIERVIAKVFTKYSITSDINDRIRSLFKAKLWRMGKKLAGLGGTKRLQAIEGMKDSDWTFVVNANEINKSLL